MENLKVINGIKYIIYKDGMTIEEDKSYYFEKDFRTDLDFRCFNCYFNGYQYVKGCQDVKGNQDVEGYQDVNYFILNNYSKRSIFINLESKVVKIGCKEKTIKEWKDWFENSTEEFETKRGTLNFKKIELDFKLAVKFRKEIIKIKKTR